MRKLIVILLIGISLYSCKKGSDGVVPVVPPPYIGTYTSTAGDTAYISQNGETYTKIRWCAMGNSGKIDIDSVLVFPDNTFTVNQFVWYDSRWETMVGTGSFGTNTSQFNFVLNTTGRITFSGVKR